MLLAPDTDILSCRFQDCDKAEDAVRRAVRPRHSSKPESAVCFAEHIACQD